MYFADAGLRTGVVISGMPWSFAKFEVLKLFDRYAPPVVLRSFHYTPRIAAAGKLIEKTLHPAVLSPDHVRAHLTALSVDFPIKTTSEYNAPKQLKDCQVKTSFSTEN